VSERWVALAAAGANREPLALALSWRIHDLAEAATPPARGRRTSASARSRPSCGRRCT
jgi:hypothetical protein